MDKIEIFKKEEFGEIRVKLINDEPWFAGIDIAKALKYTDTDQALRKHVDELDKQLVKLVDFQDPFISMGSHMQGSKLIIVNESGLYSLIFGSKLEKAKEFKRWVTFEVLPTIRKTGSYSIQHNIPKTFAEALRLAADNQERLEEAQKLIEEQKPKVEFFDAVAESKTAIEMAGVAKVLDMGIGRNQLFEFLRKKKILRDNNTPYQQYIDCGYFRVIEQKWNKPDGEVRISLKTLVYQKGLDFIRKLYLGR